MDGGSGPADELLLLPQEDDPARLADISISVESILLSTSTVYPTLSQEERGEFYKKYDPMTGIRIAATLSGFFTLAIVYIIYKAKCKKIKWLRGSSFEDSIMDQISLPSQWGDHTSCNNGLPLSEERQRKLSSISASECGRDSPLSHHSTATKSHYYVDDSDMPAWKVYAKELFLYGGSGLWRSASLKGSDPILLMQPQSFFDEAINNSRGHIRTGSLSGSMMGVLGNHYPSYCSSRYGSRKSSVAHSSAGSSQCRLQVPQEIRCGGPLPSTPPDASNVPNNGARGSCHIPGRSVSFREGSTANGSGRRIARTRPGSLRTRADHLRMTRGLNSDLGPPGAVGATGVSGGVRSGRSYSVSGSRMLPSRQASFRSNGAPEEQGMQPPPASPHLRTVIVHRIPIHPQPQPHPSDLKLPKSGDKLGRSASLCEPSTAATASGWRSSLAKLIRTKSTSGNSPDVGGRGGAESPIRNKKASPTISLAMEAAPEEINYSSGSPSESSSQSVAGATAASSEGHIDICVIHPTPAVSPCASIRTLSNDSDVVPAVRMAPRRSGRSLIQSSQSMSLRDRRKCFARMKGQTIDADVEILPIDTGSLLVPSVEYGPIIDPRCRSVSPSTASSIRSAGSGGGGPLAATGSTANTTWLQVLHQEPSLSPSKYQMPMMQQRRYGNAGRPAVEIHQSIGDRNHRRASPTPAAGGGGGAHH